MITLLRELLEMPEEHRDKLIDLLPEQTVRMLNAIAKNLLDKYDE